MASKLCSKRLQKELIHLQKNPLENIEALPNEKNILEWHYVITGPKDSLYVLIHTTRMDSLV
jgi:ubiquitin-conjugating enzyme E2 J2